MMGVYGCWRGGVNLQDGEVCGEGIRMEQGEDLEGRLEEDKEEGEDVDEEG